MRGIVGYIQRNSSLGTGLLLLIGLILFVTVGRFFIDTDHAYPLAVAAGRPPCREYPFGTDSEGRDLLAVMIVGVGKTLQIGAVAGLISISAGTVLGFLTGYYSGTAVDSVVTSIVDVLLTIPGLMLLIVIASTFRMTEVPVLTKGAIVAIVAWAGPTRAIRSQVLSMRERPFVMMAKLSGMSGWQIIMRELMPNLLPYLVTSLAGAVYGGIMGSLGLEALGIGDRREPTLGMVLFNISFYGAFIQGMWWWILWPVTAIVLVLTSLVLVAIGLDEIANPRVRRRV